MPRAFCVLQYEENFDVAKNRRTVDYKNYRVLVGNKENIEDCKTAIENSFKEGEMKSDLFRIVMRDAVL